MMLVRLLLAAVLWLPLTTAAAAVAAAPVTPDAQSRAPAPIVVLLSWDGMRHDFPDLADFPALQRLETEGVRARRLTPVFPSNTFPGHISLATGTYPDVHGIVDNVFLDREKGRYSYSADADWIEAEPLWIAAERQGVPTATYFWVGSETDWRGQGTRYREAPFDRNRPESAKVDRILEWLSLPEAEKPRLIMSYWSGADHVGHDDGPGSRHLVQEIRDQDAELGRLLAGIDALGLWPRTTLLLVSDHGMAAVTRYLNLQAAFDDAGIDAAVVGSAVAEIHLLTPVDDEAVRRTLNDFLKDVPGSAFYKREDLPDDFRLRRPNRVGDWVAVLSPPYAFSGAESMLRRIAIFLGKEYGMHGYDPTLPDMGGVFFAMGRGVPPDLRLDDVRQIDIAATAAALLGVEPPAQSEGRPILPAVE
ncbi:MAG: alkaline phosphatase family protein [Pseudomonadales bacterium]